MEQIIAALEVVAKGFNAPFVVGEVAGKEVIGDIIEKDGIYKVFNQQDELIYEIKDCPVIITYQKSEVEI
ncbi:hypothetical protein ABEV54_18390 [Peribacillus psychrosaccharolyticus]|uniref:hypothetical protein n=1 Tax=Peribacillus psychrosaccharolyticus TaxID=1407 RepID=UPI003D2CBC4F